MKSTFLGFSLFVLTGLLAMPASAQKTVAPVNPNYDEALAKRLGADERGMREYVMCFLKTGSLKVDEAAKRAELMKGHFGMINRLANEGKLILAGPFSNGGDFRGIYVFDVKTIEEAQKLTETDPSIKEGYFKVEFIKWYGSAALMDVNNIHKKIAKTNP
ncbi:MAG TPA: YciI family protein [Pyrinomonadaceae bacterium]|nr:YciI family protein [Pyrinomonadaceae bacterium]